MNEWPEASPAADWLDMERSGGIRWRARRKGGKGLGRAESGAGEMQRFAIRMADVVKARAGQRASDVRIGSAQVAMFLIIGQRLIRALRVFFKGVRNTVREAAQLRE
ncbi:MAG TPA: hypothetical protein VFK88_10545 [Gallionella sp.]|nr:hypothetical protein [Gallionella sp.]